MNVRTTKTARGLLALTVGVGVAVIAACDPGSNAVAPTALIGALGARPAQNTAPGPDREAFEVCKVYVGPDAGPVTIDVSVSDGTTFSVQLADGQCMDVWGDDLRDGIADVVTVTENPVPANYTVTHVKHYWGPTPSTGVIAGASATDGVGVQVIFTNTYTPPPPPPGNQGCTPGYWRQEHHFDSWTAPYAPLAAFSGPFTSPGSDAAIKRGKTVTNVTTQVQAVWANKGTLAALTRHAMAAVLNAASPDVAYPRTAAQIIADYNAAVSGGDFGVIDALKDDFAYDNELGCPLN